MAHKFNNAVRLRRETTLSLARIAEHLCRGTLGHLACLLCRNQEEQTKSENSSF